MTRPAGTQARGLEDTGTVSFWLVLLFVSAAAGALVLWNEATKIKDTSERLLGEYRNLLAEARKKARKAGVQEAKPYQPSGKTGQNAARPDQPKPAKTSP